MAKHAGPPCSSAFTDEPGLCTCIVSFSVWVICCLLVTRSRMILITVSHEIPIGHLLSRNCPWLASAFPRTFGEFPWDDVFCSSVVGISHLSLWVGGSFPLALMTWTSFLSEMCGNHCGPPWLPELHAVHSDRGIWAPEPAHQGDELHGEYTASHTLLQLPC